ncbi:hypothetical protein [Streptomyces sp. NPDC127072]|uniref:hypothetical protein n=1 Tax=Streptomyces sp. NPDC127072 TaxID=3347129 RepID=UPI003660C220
MAGGAYEELARDGHLGNEGFELLRRVGRQVCRTQGFPPPKGYNRWENDAVDELLHRMITREGAGGQFILTCFLKAVDDTSLEKLFFTSIRRFLIDEAKSTPRGKLRRRFAKRLAEDDRFRAVSGASPRWALAAHPVDSIWQGDLDELVRAAWEVRGVWITAWNHSGPTPQKTVHALITVLTAVLEAADGAVREEDLAKVLEARFDLLSPPLLTNLYADDGVLLHSGVDQAQESDPVAAESVAGELWHEMSSQERKLLPHLVEDPAAVASLLGLGLHQTQAIMDALSEKLRLALTDDGIHPHDVAAALLRRGGDPP